MDIVNHIKEHVVLGYGSGAPQKPLPANKIVLFGDANCDGAPFTYSGSYNPGVDNPIYYKTSANSVFRRANMRLGFPFTTIVTQNKGNLKYTDSAAGNNLATFATDVIAQAPGWVYMSVGQPDFSFNNYIANNSTTAQIRTAAANTFANVKTMITMARTAGIRVIISTILPRNGGSTFAPATHNVGVMMYNRQLREYCSTIPDVILFDAGYRLAKYDTLANAALFLPDPQFYAYNESATPSSLNGYGAQILSDSLYSALATYIPHRRSMANGAWDGSTGGDVDNGVKNSALIGTVGTKGTYVSGNVADNWTVGAWYAAYSPGTAIACSKGTHWDGSSTPTQVINITGAAAAPANGAEDYWYAAAQWTMFEMPALTLSGSQIAPGDTIFGEIEVTVTENSGSALVTMLSIEVLDASSNIVASYYYNTPNIGTSGDIVQLNGGRLVDSVLRSESITLQNAAYPGVGIAASIQMRVLMLTSGGADVTWKFARPQICKVQTY